MKEKFQNWMEQKNAMFSAIAGEQFTNADVIYTHIGLLAFIVILGITGSIS